MERGPMRNRRKKSITLDILMAGALFSDGSGHRTNRGGKRAEPIDNAGGEQRGALPGHFKKVRSLLAQPQIALSWRVTRPFGPEFRGEIIERSGFVQRDGHFESP